MKKVASLLVLTLFLVGCNGETAASDSSFSSTIDSSLSSTSSTSSTSSGVDESSSSSSSSSSSDTNVSVTSVNIDQTGPIEVSIQESSYTLSATVLPSNATNKKVSWSSSNIEVATVNMGVVYIKTIGETTISVKSKENEQIQDSILFKVVPVSVTSVSLSQTKVTLKTGYTVELNARVEPSDASDTSISWSSDNSEVASVSNEGLVTAKRSGTANIIATASNNLTATCAVIVEQAHLSSLPTSAAFATSTWTKQNNNFFYVNDSYKDVVTNVGDGVQMHTYTLPMTRGVTLTSRALIVDLSKANIEIGTPNNTYSAQPAYVGKVLKTQLQSYEDAATKGQKVLAGTNADFFGWNTTTNVTAANNAFVKDGVVINAKPASFESLKSNMMILGISYNNVPIITYSMKSATDYIELRNLIEVYDAKGVAYVTSVAIDSINDSLIADAYLGANKPNNIQVYTVSGKTINSKTVAILEKIDKYDNGVGNINFPFDGVIREIKTNYTGTLTLQDNQVAIACPYYNNLAYSFKEGNVVRVGRVDCVGNDALDNMKVIIGGRHELVRDFKVVSTVTQETTNQAQGLAARTAIGILNDGRLFIFTTSTNNTMQIKEVADFMLYQGCKYAFNLDGGGSTGIVYDDGYNGSGNLVLIGGLNSRPLPNTLIVTTKPQ